MQSTCITICNGILVGTGLTIIVNKTTWSFFPYIYNYIAQEQDRLADQLRRPHSIAGHESPDPPRSPASRLSLPVQRGKWIFGTYISNMINLTFLNEGIITTIARQTHRIYKDKTAKIFFSS